MSPTQNPYPAQGQAPVPRPGYLAPVPRNGFGITALVLAIVGVVFGLIPLTGLVAVVLGALAVLFGLLGLGRVRRGDATNKVMTIVGAALGAVALALGIYGMVVLARAAAEVADQVNQTGRQLDVYMECIEKAPTEEASRTCQLTPSG